ncbi:cytochrome P450 [Armillaria luteobubalina]|uniref:Cytochrome P450 n=1 Tax=Armillaria luteobubalina TaxID=153913 RepID=A0AA39UZ17_9AGAR|nr:cytochrome P450 [Armillaria luteobubalina]
MTVAAALATICACTIAFFLYRLKSNQPINTHFPPGPRGWLWPILGNIKDLSVDPSMLHMRFASWQPAYGDVIGLKVLGRSIIVLNSRTAIHGLLDERSAIYSDRPSIPFVTELACVDWMLPLLTYGPEMHLQRRMINQCVNTSFFHQFQKLLVNEARIFALSVRKDPKNMDALVRRMAGSSILGFTLGNHEPEKKEMLLKLAYDFDESMSVNGQPAPTLSTSYPHVLAKLPLFVFGKKLADGMKRLGICITDMLEIPYQLTKDTMETSAVGPSMTRHLIETYQDKDGTVSNERSIQASVAIAFAGLLRLQFKVFLLAMMRYPESRRKHKRTLMRQLEMIDYLTLSDREAIPYIEAIVKETSRWRPVIPMAMAHKNMQDDVYNGMFIPKGSTIIPNSWLCLHDENDFPEPDEFKPGRFTDGHKLFKDVPDPRNFAFGYGRRICPGRHFAESNLWMNIATLLSVYDIRYPVGVNGLEQKQDPKFIWKLAVLKPEEFECHFEPRSKERLEKLRIAVEEGTY